MGLLAGIHIEFYHEQPPTQRISMLLDGGWVLGDGAGGFMYLPLGPDDAFDWQIASASDHDRVMDIITEKERLRQRIGLTMTWKDANIGGSFHFEPDHKTMWITPCGNRVKLQGCGRLTDYGWYLPKVLHPFHDPNPGQHVIFRVECSDID